MQAECDPGFLLRGTRLDQFEAWVQESSMVLTENESEFLEASLAKEDSREAEEAERQAHEAALEQTFTQFPACVGGGACVAAVWR